MHLAENYSRTRQEMFFPPGKKHSNIMQEKTCDFLSIKSHKKNYGLIQEFSLTEENCS